MMVVTNNEQVREFLAQNNVIRHELHFIDGYIEDVFKYVRDLCHVGWRLSTHPLTGSIKPNQTPYKTVVLESGKGDCDAQSVIMIETSYHKTLAMLADKPRPFLTGAILADLALIDLDLFKSHLGNIISK